jgi:hypothetical protein
MTPQQFFDPTVLPPTAGLFAAAPTVLPTPDMIRPVLEATGGARRQSRRARAQRGGFYPSVMGPFVENASAAIVPMALYTVYHTLVPKQPGKILGGMWKRYVSSAAATKTRRRHRK